MSNDTQKRDLPLPPGQSLFVQDLTKGNISVYVGPSIVNISAQEQPVTYEPKTGRYTQRGLFDAVQDAIMAEEGNYVILKNPAMDGRHPQAGSRQAAPDLLEGRQVVIPGPTKFALWPGQSAEVAKGHQLRSNEYLLVKVVNEDEARNNWDKAVMRKVAATTPPPPNSDGTKPPETSADTLSLPSKAPSDLAVGKEYVIRGTEVSFYIPPTGILVVKTDEGQYVREAVTLEQLEYSILVDENGTKRYEKGPTVVFPKPTEKFITSKDGNARKSRALELGETQGLHIKVIADYTEGEKKYKQGDEIFLRGVECPIYYPRAEHAIVAYDGNQKHYATAVPAGEARYLLDRLDGKVEMISGPAMLLPDPRKQVIVKRPLSAKQVQLYYPGNQKAQEYNEILRQLATKSPTTRQGTVSEGELARATNSKKPGQTLEGGSRSLSSGHHGMEVFGAVRSNSTASNQTALAGDEFIRGSTYTQPRTLVLDTKFEGVPTIVVWNGYAIQVVDSAGSRRVVKGPATVALQFDESLQSFNLSTGKPKTTDALIEDVYLRYQNNKVSDIIDVETKDLVPVQIKLSYNVDFTGDESKWFNVDNYVKWLCDRCRSLLKGTAKKMTVAEFYSDAAAIIRDTILSTKTEGRRPGLLFEQNGMLISDVEVAAVVIRDNEVASLITTAQREEIKASLKRVEIDRSIEMVKLEERRKQEIASLQTDTSVFKNKLQAEEAKAKETLSLTELDSEQAVAKARREAHAAELENDKKVKLFSEELTTILNESQLKRQKIMEEQKLELDTAKQDLLLEKLKAETEATKQKFEALGGPLAEVLTNLGNQDVLTKVAEAMSVQHLLGGKDMVDVLTKTFDGTHLGSLFQQLALQAGRVTTQRNTAVNNKNG